MALPPHIGGETGAVYLIFGRWDSPFVRGTRPVSIITLNQFVALFIHPFCSKILYRTLL